MVDPINDATSASTERSAQCSKPPRTTHFTRFFSCNSRQDSLFAVNGDLPLSNALEQVECFLEACEFTVRGLVMGADRDGSHARLWPVLYLLEMSRAVLESANKAEAMEGENHD